jgi:hypothetical protein
MTCFESAYTKILHETTDLLKKDGIAILVVGDARASNQFLIKDMRSLTIEAMREKSFMLYNEYVVLNPLGSKRLLARKFFDYRRKIVRCHQYALVFGRHYKDFQARGSGN